MTDTERDEILALTAQVSRLAGALEAREDRCRDHRHRIERLEGAVGKQNVIASVLGALGGALVLAAKTFAGRG